jgi:hypothetical protein
MVGRVGTCVPPNEGSPQLPSIDCVILGKSLNFSQQRVFMGSMGITLSLPPGAVVKPLWSEYYSASEMEALHFRVAAG